jgi:hypothetical protein
LSSGGGSTFLWQRLNPLSLCDILSTDPVPTVFQVKHRVTIFL